MSTLHSLTLATGVPTVQEMHEEVLLALKQFGEYTFGDKGASEVMGVSGLAERVRQADAVEAAQLLRRLAHSGPDDGFRRHCASRAAGEIVLELQDWDELFEQPGIDDLLNLGLPPAEPGDTPVGQAAQQAARRARPL